jgi:NAD(P)-dependent dehydrogenase (short-subunit alcohol dehydrogenase family)
MKILVIGSTGTIGAAVARALSERGHQVIGLHRNSTPALDITKTSAIEAAFASVRDLDAVVSCAGSAAWKPLAQLTDDDFAMSLRDKLMGQVNIIRHALGHVRDGGSVTVTSGVLAENPMPGAAAISLVNAGLQAFVRGAALEAPRGIRVNVVSPPWVTTTLEKLGRDTSIGLTPAQVAQAYVDAVTGTQSGQTIHPTPRVA